jgi:hypothetical protein
MKRSVLRAAVVLAAATASLPVLAADVPSTKILAPTALWGSLPTVAMTHIPLSRSAPAAIARGEHAPGVWLVKPKWMQPYEDRATASVVGSETLADELRTGQYKGRDNDVCLALSAMPAVADDVDQARYWSSQMQSQTQFSWQPPWRSDNAWTVAHRPLRVAAVHLEKLVRDDDGGASLDYRDVWVDPVTMGSRAITSGVLHLARVATGPTGLVVYAARDKDVVHFVVEPGASPSDEPTLRNVVRNVSAQLPQPFNFGSSDCGFLRATLPATADSAEMATVTTTAITGITIPPPRTDGSNERPRTARRRTLLVHASATQSSVDPEPVLSIAMGWSGREDEFQF